MWSTKSNHLRQLSPGLKRQAAPYYFVVLTDKHRRKKKHYVHYLVARAYCDGWDEGLEVNHKNRNGLDNRASNLEWVSKGDNQRHCTTTKGAKLDEKVKEKAKKLHALLLSRGVELPDLHSFINAVLEGEIDRIAHEITM